MNEIKTEYKGIEITYNEFLDKWQCVLSDKDYEKESLALVKKKIDDFMKKEKAFERYEAYQYDWNEPNPFPIATVTSEADRENVWIVGKNWRGDTSRSKSRKRHLYKKNEFNEKKISEYLEQRKIRDAAQKQMNLILSQLERID